MQISNVTIQSFLFFITNLPSCLRYQHQHLHPLQAAFVNVPALKRQLRAALEHLAVHGPDGGSGSNGHTNRWAAGSGVKAFHSAMNALPPVIQSPEEEFRDDFSTFKKENKEKQKNSFHSSFPLLE